VKSPWNEGGYAYLIPSFQALTDTQRQTITLRQETISNHPFINQGGRMMRTSFFILCLGVFLIFGMTGSAFALQSGGVEIGNLESGSVVGQSFKSLDVDIAFTAMKIGSSQGWYPPTAVLSLVAQGTGGRAGRPVLLKVTNTLGGDYTFHLSADSAFAGPTSMTAKVTLKSGETKYIGIPTSDLTYVTANSLLNYTNPSAQGDEGGQLLILR
jgi:hypothetical protein